MKQKVQCLPGCSLCSKFNPIDSQISASNKSDNIPFTSAVDCVNAIIYFVVEINRKQFSGNDINNAASKIAGIYESKGSHPWVRIIAESAGDLRAHILISQGLD